MRFGKLLLISSALSLTMATAVFADALTENAVTETQASEAQTEAPVMPAAGSIYYYYQTQLYLMDAENNLVPVAATEVKDNTYDATQEWIRVLGVRARGDLQAILKITDASDSNMTLGYSYTPDGEIFYPLNYILSDRNWYFDYDEDGQLTGDEKSTMVLTDANTIVDYSYGNVEKYEVNSDWPSLASMYGWGEGTPICVVTTYRKDVPLNLNY